MLAKRSPAAAAATTAIPPRAAPHKHPACLPAARASQRFGFIGDAKAGVPRTAYRGVVTVSHLGCTKLLVPTDFKAGS